MYLKGEVVLRLEKHKGSMEGRKKEIKEEGDKGGRGDKEKEEKKKR